MTAFAGGFAGDQAAQQTMIAGGLQERTNLTQSFASGAVAYVVTEGVRSTPTLEPAVRPAPSGATAAPRPGSQALVRRDFETLAPNRGFAAGFTTKETLAPGTVIDRFGGRGGRFVSPAGTPFSARGLPPENARLPHQRLEVLKPLEVDAGIAGHAFGSGGGVQYELPASVQKLIDAGVLRVVK